MTTSPAVKPPMDVSRITPAPGSIRALLQSSAVTKRFEQVMNNPNKAAQFVSSLAQLVYANRQLQACSFESIMASAIQAAALDLAIDTNLGQAFIIPYGSEARFQIGYKGYTQLALRTGMYEMLNVAHAMEGEITVVNRFTGELRFSEPTSDQAAGVVAYLKLINGFQHFEYWTLARIEAHAKKFSKSYGKASSGWTTNPEAMQKKTVLLDLLRHYGVMSIEMRQALAAETAGYDETGAETAGGNGHGDRSAVNAALFGGDEPTPATPADNAALDREIVEAEKAKA